MADKTPDPNALALARYGVRPDSGEDATPGVCTAIADCRKSGIKRLNFGAGRYDFWPDRATEHFLFISNNDEGLKRIGFPLCGLDSLEIDGRGASFVFHGPMVPFLIEKCHGLTLRNLSFDFVRPFHSEAEVVAVTERSVDLKFSPHFPYEIRHGVLVFTDGPSLSGQRTTVDSAGKIYPVSNLLAFDPNKRETAFMSDDLYGVSQGMPASEIEAGHVRIHLKGFSANPGDRLIFGSPRGYPGIVISDSASVCLDHVTIHHCGGMGVIAQRSADLTLDGVRVTPPAGTDRMVSATADATHFVNCRGAITMQNCVFEQQMDDASNIHGLYAKVTRQLAPDRFEIRMVHPQQAGVDFVVPGMELEITDGPSLEGRGSADVRHVTRINKEYSLIQTREPADICVGDAVADAQANTADVLIRACLFRGNRARGLLLGSRGRMVIEGCTFHTPGSAILFEGDASYWFEQAGVRDVFIHNNTFDNCNFGVWGSACIEVRAGIAKDLRKTSRYNRNICLHGNRFQVFGSHPLLSVFSVDGLDFRGNSLEITAAYPAAERGPCPAFKIAHCDNVRIEEPKRSSPGLFHPPNK